MVTKTEILHDFSLFSVPTGGIGNRLTEDTHDDVFSCLGKVDEEPLPAVQLNRLLVLGHEAPVGDDSFRYYWLLAPEQHPYDVRAIPDFSPSFLESSGAIISLSHLKWGLYRLYVDALLYSGNIRTDFRRLRDLPLSEINTNATNKRLMLIQQVTACSRVPFPLYWVQI